MRNPIALCLALAMLVAACGSGDASESGLDGVLDCQPEAWSTTYSYEADAEGSLTPIAAMESWAQAYMGADYLIEIVDARTGTVVIEGAEIALIKVVELPTETFAATRVSGCEGFER